MDPKRRSKMRKGRNGPNAQEAREIGRLDDFVRRSAKHDIGPLDRSEFVRALTGGLKAGRAMGQTLGSAPDDGTGGTEPRHRRPTASR
jgi:hypothetical protein